MDILLNPAKTNCIVFPACPNSLPGLPLHFMNTEIVFVPSCTFFGISVSSHDISGRNIPQSIQKLYRRSNDVMSDFKSLSRNVKSQLFSTFCLDAYGYGLFNNSVKLYYTAWRKVIRKAWWLQTTQPTSGGAVTADSSCCANCIEPPHPQQWGPDLPFFGHAARADSLDGWRFCSQKRVMSRPIQVRQL